MVDWLAGMHRARRRHRPARLPAPLLETAAPRRSNPGAEFLGPTPTRRAAPSRPAAASCASPACGRAGSSLPPTRTPTRCAKPSPASSEWWAGLVRIHAPGALDPRPGGHARHLQRGRAPGLALAGARRAAWPRATCCASICIRPTSTIRATSARWKACFSVRIAASATPSPTTTSLSELPPGAAQGTPGPHAPSLPRPPPSFSPSLPPPPPPPPPPSPPPPPPPPPPLPPPPLPPLPPPPPPRRCLTSRDYDPRSGRGWRPGTFPGRRWAADLASA